MKDQNENTASPVEEAAAPVSHGDAQSGSVLPGAALRGAREKLGLSVADVAAQTKLAPRQIEALEADDFENLPEMPFVRGFIRSYAKVLQLDVQSLLDSLPKAATQSDTQRIERKSVEAPFPDAHAPRVQNLVWLGAALFLSVAVVAFAVWQFTSPRVEPAPEASHAVELPVALPSDARLLTESGVAASEVMAAAPATAKSSEKQIVTEAKQIIAETKPAVTETKPIVAVPKPVESKPVVPTPTLPVATQPAKTPTAAPVKDAAAVSPQPAPKTTPAVTSSVAAAAAAVPGNSLHMKFSEESWVEVRNAKGELVSSQVHAAGSEFSLKGQGPYALVVGHAATTQVYFKGKKVELAPYVRTNSDVARLTVE